LDFHQGEGMQWHNDSRVMWDVVCREVYCEEERMIGLYFE
jgi:hypothetical protein